jgi:glutathione peroxidase
MNRRDLLAALAVSAALPARLRADEDGAHAFRFDSLDGAIDGEADAAIDLAAFAGRPLLVVNTASKCGFAPQYAGLQKLWETYSDRGLMVIGTPSADFGGQEYDDPSKIKEFCELTYAVDFPLTEPLHVRGPDAHPFWAWAQAEGAARTPTLPAPGWNFHKYLVAPDGALAAGFDTRVPPEDPRIVAAVEALLPGG